MSSGKFSVRIENGVLVRKGRPAFLSSTNKNLPVGKGQDRRHILHGAVQITDVLIKTFNWIISKKGLDSCMYIIDKYLTRYREHKIIRQIPKTNEAKIQKIIQIAFGRPCNLVVGASKHNQAIEKARSSIVSIKNKIASYLFDKTKVFAEIRGSVLDIIRASSYSSSNGKIAKRRVKILRLLYEAVSFTTNITDLRDMIEDFEFSCTLDICHDGTTKAQNIWGLEMSAKLQNAIENKDSKGIFKILL